LKELLPQKLLNDLEDIKGFNRQSFQHAHITAQQITSIRFNPKKLKRFAFSDETIHPEFNFEQQIPWCEYGFYLDERPAFTLDPLLHAGAYYVQEASSMFLYEVLKQTCEDTNNKVLDLCAAPGGKSSLITSYFKNSLLVSNEAINQRANILYENLTKWGSTNVVITNNDAADFKRLENYFDVVMVDAPCSGSGLFRKDAEAINEWSIKNVELCNQRQQRILADVYTAIKQDGILIYSTCSYSKEEDEDILDWLRSNFDVDTIQLKLEEEWAIVETQSEQHKAYGYRFWPDKIKGEGFFIAAFRKNDGDPSNYKSRKNYLKKVTNKDAAIVLNYINEDDWLIFNHKENIRVINNKWRNDISILQENLHIRKAGINLGEIMQNELIPHHELALSTIIKNAVQKIDFTKEEALQYLHKREIQPDNKYKGWTLSTYKNYPLGWLKFLHNRVNNYYPINWRILKD
jgi:16S rRNA C967 or C1407 C5-methylase (RsmB/RsmF family)/NOL1/NOP2/fmu family ribosome biogenesis protein